MSTPSSLRSVVLVAALAATCVAAGAQTQAQNPPSQNQAQPNQNSTQTQPQTGQAQPPQAQPKQSFWQKMKQSALQDMQNPTQQGAQQAQQGVQQGAQTIQQGSQQVMAGAGSGNAALGGGNSNTSCGATCFNAGPVLANVSEMTMSQEGGWHVIRMNIQFQNATNQPLIIAYHDGSMIMTDNNGNSYQACGGNPGELQGMGIDRGAQTDPQFVLSPGQTGSALFCVARGRPANSPIGTGYTYNLTVDELQTQNGATALVTRSYNLNFPTLTPGTSFASLSGSGKGIIGGSRGSNTAGSGVAPSTATSATLPAMQAPHAATAPQNTGLTNAAMRTPVAATAKPTAAVKPSQATTSTTAKKPASTNNTQPSTNGPSNY